MRAKVVGLAEAVTGRILRAVTLGAIGFFMGSAK